MIYRVLLDADILYSAALRDIFMQISISGLLKARWTTAIHTAWVEALLEKNPQLPRSTLERVRELMDKHAEDALITGYDTLIQSLQLPDPSDRHVLAMVLERVRDLIDKHAEDELIAGHSALMESLQLPDPNNRQILATAIVGKCNAVVTQNLKDLPTPILNKYRIEVFYPDAILSLLLKHQPVEFCQALQKVRARLKNPPYTVDEYLNILTQNGLKNTVAALDTYRAFI